MEPLTIACKPVVPTLRVVLLSIRHALEKLVRVIAKAIPAPGSSPTRDGVGILAITIRAHVGTGAGIKLIGLSKSE